jgi:hypothetical protein
MTFHNDDQTDELSLTQHFRRTHNGSKVTHLFRNVNSMSASIPSPDSPSATFSTSARASHPQPTSVPLPVRLESDIASPTSEHFHIAAAPPVVGLDHSLDPDCSSRFDQPPLAGLVGLAWHFTLWYKIIVRILLFPEGLPTDELHMRVFMERLLQGLEEIFPPHSVEDRAPRARGEEDDPTGREVGFGRNELDER